MSIKPTSFFKLENGLFIGQEPARGPWSAVHCHAGPVAGAIARALEIEIGPEKALTRLTIDLVRAVPLAGFTIEAETVHSGRKLANGRAVLTDLDGRVCATASSMHITEADFDPFPTAPVDPPRFAEATPGPFSITRPAHKLPAFGDFIETAYPPGEDKSPGPTTLWMKTLPLLPDEVPTPFQRLCPLADCGNAISRNANINEYQFLNTDLTIVAHRHSESEWLASTATSHWHPTGRGLAHAILYDDAGPIATALQALIIRPL